MDEGCACAPLHNLILSPSPSLPTQLYNLVSHSMTSTFCADPALSNGPIVLINILADSLNYGYNGRPWRVLESLNGRKISTMDQLCET